MLVALESTIAASRLRVVAQRGSYAPPLAAFFPCFVLALWEGELISWLVTVTRGLKWRSVNGGPLVAFKPQNEVSGEADEPVAG